MRYLFFNIFDLSIINFFLITSFFTTVLSLLKSKETGGNLLTSNLSTLLFKLLKSSGIVFNLSISNLSTLDFELAKSTFLANFYVSTPAAPTAQLGKSNSTFTLSSEDFGSENIHSFILCLFYQSNC